MASVLIQTCKYEYVLSSWSMTINDLQFQYVVSLLACAVDCFHTKTCNTFNAVRDDPLNCQISKTKGVCMDKEEVFRRPGSRMYQQKVYKSSFT